ncbi:MAG: hypothetical protein Q7S23_02330 [bacterium]|nr:hypothetical protein [bacterium]
MRQVAIKTKTRVSAEPSLIVTQVILAAALAVPLGVFAAALGVISTRNNSGQVRIAYYASATPTPSPSATPAPVLSAPTNFQVVEVGQNHIWLNWDSVAGASAYVVYNGTQRLTTFDASGFQSGYFLNYLTSNTTYVLAVAAMGADSKQSGKTPSKTVSTAPAKDKCEGTKLVEGYSSSIYPQCNDTNGNQVCARAASDLAVKVAAVTCDSPCKKYYTPEPPHQDGAHCNPLSQAAIDLIKKWTGFDASNYKMVTCKKWVTVYCAVSAPEGATAAP